jgi:hypothetical protein
MGNSKRAARYFFPLPRILKKQTAIEEKNIIFQI